MKPFLLCFLLACAPPAVAAEEILVAPVNLGFEAGTSGVPPGWKVSGQGGDLEATTVSDGCLEGSRCARLIRKGIEPGIGALVQVVRADAYRNKRIRLRGSVRQTGGKSRALLYLQTNRPGTAPESLTGQAAGSDWRADVLITDIAADAETLQFGLVETGPAEAWIDAVSVEILGEAGLGNEPSRALSKQGARNLMAFARLVEWVRYFHPSDPSSQLDWSDWTVNVIAAVEGAKDTPELARRLDRLVRPIAPTARVFESAHAPKPLPPVTAADARPIAWRHYGLGTGTSQPRARFSSLRAGGFAKPEGSGELTWILDATALRGTTLRLAALARMEASKETPGRAELSVSVTDLDGRSLADERRPIDGEEWQENAVAIQVPMNAASISFGGRISGGGRLFLDNFIVTSSTGQDSPSGVVLADGFERDVLGAYPEGWFVSPATRAAGYRVEVSGQRPGEGLHCLEISWDLSADLPDPASLPVVTDLGEGVSARVPFVLFSDLQGTLPHEARALTFDRNKPDGFLPSGRDRATRLADVLLLWAALDSFYPYPLPEEWSRNLDLALHKAAEDREERNFLETLRRLIAGLKDDHATVSHALGRADYRLPLLWSWMENRVVVTWVESAQKEVRIGDVVEEVDGKPVAEALAEIERSVSAATPIYRRYRALELLAAASSGASRTLRLRRDSKVFEVTLRATAPLAGPDRLRGRRPEKITELRPGLFYLDLDRIDDQDFEKALPRLREAKGLIFDLRGYPERISETLLAHLISAPAKTPGTWIAIRTRHDRPPKLDHLSWTLQPLSPRLAARAVFLTDERAYSRAETYLDIVSFYHLGDLIGRTTGGTNGEVVEMNLSGGYHVTWTGSRVKRLNGSEIQGVGIPPTIPVEPTVAGVTAGRDEILERAVLLFE